MFRLEPLAWVWCDPDIILCINVSTLPLVRAKKKCYHSKRSLTKYSNIKQQHKDEIVCTRSCHVFTSTTNKDASDVYAYTWTIFWFRLLFLYILMFKIVRKKWVFFLSISLCISRCWTLNCFVYLYFRESVLRSIFFRWHFVGDIIFSLGKNMDTQKMIE